MIEEIRFVLVFLALVFAGVFIVSGIGIICIVLYTYWEDMRRGE